MTDLHLGLDLLFLLLTNQIQVAEIGLLQQHEWSKKQQNQGEEPHTSSGPISSSLLMRSVKNSVMSFCSPVLSG